MLLHVYLYFLAFLWWRVHSLSHSSAIYPMLHSVQRREPVEQVWDTHVRYGLQRPSLKDAMIAALQVIYLFYSYIWDLHVLNS